MISQAYSRKNTPFAFPLSLGKLKAKFARIFVEIKRSLFCGEINHVIIRIEWEYISGGLRAQLNSMIIMTPLTLSTKDSSTPLHEQT